MREILFRGKTDKGEWVQGVPFFEEDRCYIIEDLFLCDEYACTGADNSSVIPETVGQYTGLTDKNGTKIFEGDIVQSIELELKGIIVFDEHCRFMIKEVPTGATYLISYNCDEIKVIGNIHDNPELLKGGAE